MSLWKVCRPRADCLILFKVERSGQRLAERLNCTEPDPLPCLQVSFFLDFGRVTFCHIRHWRDLWSWTLPKGSKISSYLTANSSSPHQTSTQTRKIRSFLTILSTRPSRACSRRWSGVNHNVQLVAGSLYIWDQLRRGRGHLALGPDQTL